MADLEENPFADATPINPPYPSDDVSSDESEGISQIDEVQPSATAFDTQQREKTHFCCQIDRILHAGDFHIAVNNAQKTSDGGGSSYITYSIRLDEYEVRRRYSEFESLRRGLSKLYPTVIIPPIPEKHSIADYATLPSKAKEELIIEKRKRMLQTFLNRVATHQLLKNEHVFHKFLETGISWNEVLHAPPLSNLPKNILQISPANLPSTNPNALSSQQPISQPPLPNPSASQQLKNPDSRFIESEAFTNRFANHLSQNMEKTNRRILKRLGDLSNDYAELGATYNTFSLDESGDLAKAIEKIGQAIDSCFVATGNLITSLETDFSEPLQEYSQFANIIKQVLKYRHMKHLQMELTTESLEKQKTALENLERSEQEAKRLEAALKNHGGTEDLNRPRRLSAGDVGQSRDSDDSENRGELEREYNGINSGGGKQLKKRRSTLFSVLSHTLHGIMDVDPEASRRSSLGKTRESIIQLEEALVTTSKDLKIISSAIQADLDRFQRQKIHDMREMLLAYARHHVKWCDTNLASWQEAKSEIEKI